MNHLIMKQVIDLRVNARLNPFSVQQQAKEYYYDHILPVIEKIFDELSSDGEVMSIDKLEIDIGELVWKNDRFEIDDSSIYALVKESLERSLSHTTMRRTPEENACIQWLSYMENGALPWGIRVIAEKWLTQVLHQLAIDHSLIEKTKHLIINNRWFLARIARDHDDSFLKKLIEIITARQHPDLLEKVRQSVNVNIHNNDNAVRSKAEIWKVMLRSAAAGEKEVDIKNLSFREAGSKTSHPIIQHKEVTEGIYCQFAGLLLVHPFLRHLFGRLQLLEDLNFKDDLSRHRAIALLCFIATGKTEGKDHELIVPKILCGLPLHEVLMEESFMLTSDEKAEALNMMHAAIEQWTIMHGTSPEGLREGFLIREGKVIIRDSAIEFRVESSAIDVLLDHLPWNLSLIKLPWLNKLIRVDWR